jgi:hypothetical protein
MSDQEAILEVLGLLSYTRCPFFQGTGKCDRGCHTEPACITDAPLEGWVQSAIALLEEQLGPHDHGGPHG